MIVRPMLGDWELPCIQRIELQQTRRQVRLGIPGLAGDLHQDLGAESLTIAVTGSLAGDDQRSDLLDHLHQAFSSGDPQPFVADIVDSSELEDVVIVGFDVVETDEWTDAVRYRIVLRQYVEPPEPPSLSPDLGVDDLAGLSDLAGSLLDGLDLPGLLGSVPSLSDPSEPIKPAMESVKSAVGSLPGMLGDLGAALGVGG